jgi:hypothetical protein
LRGVAPLQRPRRVSFIVRRQQQAASFAYFDVFWAATVASLGLMFLVFLMKRSGAEKSPRQEEEK